MVLTGCLRKNVMSAMPMPTLATSSQAMPMFTTHLSRLRPIAVPATMKGNEVACISPATSTCRRGSSERYSSAGTPRTSSSAARKTGTRSSVDALCVSADRS